MQQAEVVHARVDKVREVHRGEAELEAYCGRLKHLLAQGGQLQAIQLYTVARPTPEPEARPLRRLELDAIAANLRGRLPGLPVEVYYGPEEWA